MLRRLAPLALLFALAAPPAPAADMPKELKLIPSDAAVFVHVNIATLYDGMLADILKGLKPEDAKAALENAAKSFGFNPADVSTYTYAMPSLDGPDGPISRVSVITFRKPLDVKAKLTEMKKTMEKSGELTQKEAVLMLVIDHPYDRTKKVTVITDLTDPLRLVTIQGVGAEVMKPTDGKGVHADVFAKHDGAALLAGVNLAKLPTEAKKADLPEALAPYKAFLLAERVGLVATASKEKLTYTASVVSKDKENAADVVKAFEAGRKYLAGAMTDARKQSEGDEDGPKGVAAVFDAFDAALKDATVKSDGGTVTAVATLHEPGKLMGPAVEKVRQAAARMTVSNNLHQIGIAKHNYESTYAHLPPAAITNKNGKKLLSWRVALLPYLEEGALYNKFKLDEAWDSEHNLKVMKDNPMPKVFALPDTTNDKDKKTHFQVVSGTGTAFDPAKKITIVQIADGTSNTIMTALAADAVEWTKPDDIPFDPKKDVKEKFLKKYGGYLVGLCDGSVRVFKPGIKEESLKAYITASGGEVTTGDE